MNFLILLVVLIAIFIILNVTGMVWFGHLYDKRKEKEKKNDDTRSDRNS